MKKICKILYLALMMAVLALPANGLASDAPEVDMWFTWKEENGEWHEWVGCTQENRSVLYNLQLKVGQPVKCKVKFATYFTCRIDFCLTDPGTTSAYKVIEGEGIDEDVHFPYVKGENTTEYMWKLVPNGEWVGGNAPINLFWTVFAGEEHRYEDTYAFTNPTIIDEEWQGDSGNGEDNETSDSGGGGIPGFEGLLLLAAMLIVLIVVQVKRKRWQE